MIITKLIAKNFKKHKTTNLDFTPGKNLITGPNYSGKSTILQAVLVGLYGNSMAPGTTADLIHDDAKDFEIELHLDNGVCIKRTSRNSSIVGGDGEIKVRTHSAVNKWCEEMLETDRKTFLKVFASEQGSPQALLSMEGAELQKFIESAIGLERLDKVKKLVSSKAIQAKANFSAYSSLLLTEAVREEYMTTAEQCAMRFTLNTTAVVEAEEVLAILEEESISTKAELSRQVKAKTTADVYAESKRVLTELLSNLPSRIDLVDTVNMKAVLKADVAAYHEYWAAKSRHTSASKTVIETSTYLEEKIEDSQFSMPPAVCADEAREILRVCTSKVTAAGEEVTRLQTSLASSSCPTCKRVYSEAKDVDGLNEALLTAREAVDEAVSLRVKALADLEAKKIEEAAFVKADNKATRLKGAISELRLQLAKAITKRDGCAVNPIDKYEGSEWREYITEQQDIVDKLDKDNALSVQTEERRTELSSKLAALIVPEETGGFTIDALEITLSELQERLQGLHKERLEHQACAVEAKTQRASLMESLEKDAGTRALVKGFSKSVTNYEAVSNALTSARTVASRDAFEQTLGIASEFVKTCTGGDISEVFMSDSGIRYKEDGRDRGTVSASGAQKTLIGLGMKLGLSHIVKSPFGSLLLDEISADMDDDISLACLTVLGDYCEQALVVSHMPSDVADNVIEL